MSRLPAAALLLLAACATARPTPYAATSCPLPAGALGYPVTASSTDSNVSPLRLRAVARAVADHWTTDDDPTVEADSTPAVLQQIWAAVDRGESFSRGGWRPSDDDRATLLLVYRSGREPEAKLVGAGSPTKFESRALRAARRAIERSATRRIMRDTLPLVIPGTGDSTLILVAFGREPDARSGVARFAIQERKVRMLSSSTLPRYPLASRPGEGDVKATFVVLPDGTPDVANVHVVHNTADAFAASVLERLPAYRFEPAQLDCREVPMVVTLPFVFRTSISPTMRP